MVHPLSTIYYPPLILPLLHERFHRGPLPDGAFAGVPHRVFLHWHGDALLYGRVALLLFEIRGLLSDCEQIDDA